MSESTWEHSRKIHLQWSFLHAQLRKTQNNTDISGLGKSCHTGRRCRWGWKPEKTMRLWRWGVMCWSSAFTEQIYTSGPTSYPLVWMFTFLFSWTRRTWTMSCCVSSKGKLCKKPGQNLSDIFQSLETVWRILSKKASCVSLIPQQSNPNTPKWIHLQSHTHPGLKGAIHLFPNTNVEPCARACFYLFPSKQALGVGGGTHSYSWLCSLFSSAAALWVCVLETTLHLHLSRSSLHPYMHMQIPDWEFPNTCDWHESPGEVDTSWYRCQNKTETLCGWSFIPIRVSSCTVFVLISQCANQLSHSPPLHALMISVYK